MNKQHINITVREDTLKYVDTIVQQNGLSRSAVIDSMLSIVETYFTDDMLRMELEVHKPVDGRRKLKVS